jgi:hypothetical protein
MWVMGHQTRGRGVKDEICEIRRELAEVYKQLREQEAAGVYDSDQDCKQSVLDYLVHRLVDDRYQCETIDPEHKETVCDLASVYVEDPSFHHPALRTLLLVELLNCGLVALRIRSGFPCGPDVFLTSVEQPLPDSSWPISSSALWWTGTLISLLGVWFTFEMELVWLSGGVVLLTIRRIAARRKTDQRINCGKEQLVKQYEALRRIRDEVKGGAYCPREIARRLHRAERSGPVVPSITYAVLQTRRPNLPKAHDAEQETELEWDDLPFYEPEPCDQPKPDGSIQPEKNESKRLTRSPE